MGLDYSLVNKIMCSREGGVFQRCGNLEAPKPGTGPA